MSLVILFISLAITDTLATLKNCVSVLLIIRYSLLMADRLGFSFFFFNMFCVCCYRRKQYAGEAMGLCM